MCNPSWLTSASDLRFPNPVEAERGLLKGGLAMVTQHPFRAQSDTAALT